MMNELTQDAARIVDILSRSKCVIPYYLSGDAALAMLLGHRKATTVELERWRSRLTEDLTVDRKAIEEELAKVGTIEDCTVHSEGHIVFRVDGTEVSFRCHEEVSPIGEVLFLSEYMRMADLQALAVGKIFRLMEKRSLIDYYDLYSLSLYGVSVPDSVAVAVRQSGYRIRTREAVLLLTHPERLVPDTGGIVCPKHGTDAESIGVHMRSILYSASDVRIYVEEGQPMMSACFHKTRHRPVDITEQEYREFLCDSSVTDRLMETYFLKQAYPRNAGVKRIAGARVFAPVAGMYDVRESGNGKQQKGKV